MLKEYCLEGKQKTFNKHIVNIFGIYIALGFVKEISVALAVPKKRYKGFSDRDGR